MVFFQYMLIVTRPAAPVPLPAGKPGSAAAAGSGAASKAGAKVAAEEQKVTYGAR